MWFNISASSENKNAIIGRDAISKKMNPAEISAQRNSPLNVFVRNTKGVELGNL
jgi:hypothetical protein